MTNHLLARAEQHREQTPGTYTARYGSHRLVYFEFYRYVSNAIAREKELKRWTRAQRIALIEKVNPTWEDMYPLLASSEKQIPFGDDNKKSNSKGKATLNDATLSDTSDATDA